MEADSTKPEQQPPLPRIAGKPDALRRLLEEGSVAFTDGLGDGPLEFGDPLPTANRVKPAAQSLTSTDMAPDFVELGKGRGLRDERLAARACNGVGRRMLPSCTRL